MKREHKYSDPTLRHAVQQRLSNYHLPDSVRKAVMNEVMAASDMPRPTSRRMMLLRPRVIRFAAGAAIAAVLALAFLIINNNEYVSPTKKGKPELIALTHAEQEAAASSPPKGQEVELIINTPLSEPTVKVSTPRTKHKHKKAQMAVPEETTQQPTEISPSIDDPDGAAILAAEQRHILEVEAAALERAITVQQENTLASLTATTPS